MVSTFNFQCDEIQTLTNLVTSGGKFWGIMLFDFLVKIYALLAALDSKKNYSYYVWI